MNAYDEVAAANYPGGERDGTRVLEGLSGGFAGGWIMNALIPFLGEAMGVGELLVAVLCVAVITFANRPAPASTEKRPIARRPFA